ncbi:MAG: hypothetical protein KC449_22490, partial [Anaerolineales bacterium]|nr:hypothetical protein [Anaerolineales bacterium]
MNFIKNTPLKYKPLIVFAILAIINATGIYLLKQFAIDEIAESVIPTQRIVGEFGFLTKEV